MKTLKQFREEYESKVLDQVEILPDEFVLEGKSGGSISNIPPLSVMPTLLLFRRISYKLYPGKNVVALYYSKAVDKYLSIPFGPSGNLNLSEAEVLDSIDEEILEENETSSQNFKVRLNELRMQRNEGIMSALDTGAEAIVPYYSAGKKLYKGDYKGAAKDAAVDTATLALGAGLGKIGVGAMKLAGKGISKIGSKLGGTAVKRDASAIAKSASKTPKAPKPSLMSRMGKTAAIAGAAGAGAEIGSKAAAPATDSSAKVGDFSHAKTTAKLHSSWESKPSGPDPVTKSRIQRAMQQSFRENKITDIRKMINEGNEEMDLHINGRSITLNTSMAKRILEVYDSVNTKNKKIVESMLNEDLESFKKLLNFSIRN